MKGYQSGKIKQKNKFANFLQWYDANILQLLISISIFFIPLYFKIPLKYLEYTFVKIRFDDIFIAVVFIVFFIQLIRKKAYLPPFWFKTFLLFWISILISHIIGRYYFVNTYPNNDVALLHTLRRIEYMGMFFVAYSALNHKDNIKRFMHHLVLVTLMVSIYGILQKYGIFFEPIRNYFNSLSNSGGILAPLWDSLETMFTFPAIQTMNPEFARGHLLTLTPDARVSSTFAGHYDLAAYLVFVLPVVISRYLSVEEYKIPVISYISGIFIMFLTSSRVSFAALVASLVSFFVSTKKWGLLIFTIILIFGFSKLTESSTSLASRFAQTVQKKNILFNNDSYLIPQEATTSALPAGGAFIGNAKDTQLTDKEKEEALKRIKADIAKQANSQNQFLTPEQLDKLAREQFASFIPKQVTTLDTSLSVRFDVSWPRAIAALKQSPLFGKGAFSITEATDGDYMRNLGEFGLVGFSLFAFIIISLIRHIYIVITKQSNISVIYYILSALASTALGIFITNFIFTKLQLFTVDYAFIILAPVICAILYGFIIILLQLFFNKKIYHSYLYIAFIAGLLGLCINALLIDVFEASKVAYIFWIIAGLLVKHGEFTLNTSHETK